MTGDQQAFSSFYDALWEPLFKFVVRAVNDTDDAMDIVQIAAHLNVGANQPESYSGVVVGNRVFNKRNYFLRIPRKKINNNNLLTSNPGWQLKI